MFTSVAQPRVTWSGCPATPSGASWPGSTKTLGGPGARRAARVGGLWIDFTVDRDQRQVDVSEIGPRGEMYRRL